MRYFHLYANRKTVKEISEQQYAKLSKRPGYFTCGVADGYVLLVKGHYVICVPRVQLKQVLNGKNEGESGK